MGANIRRELKVGDYFWHDTEPRDQDGKIYPGNHIYNDTERAFVRFIMATLCDKGNFLRETFDKSLFVCNDVYFMYLRTDFCTFYMLLMPLGWMPTVWGHQKWTCTHKRIQWSCSEWCPVMAGHTSISWCSSVGLRACRLPYHIRITHSEHMHILNLRDCLLQCDLIHVFYFVLLIN